MPPRLRLLCHKTAQPGRPRRRAQLARLVAAAATLTSVASCTAVTTGAGTPATHSASATASPTTPAAVPTVDFSDCSKLIDASAAGIAADRAKNLTFSCGKAAVPRNYANPTGAKISLFILKVHDKTKTGQKPLFVNPGGPGGSGVLTAVSLAGTVSQNLLNSFDIVGFDPRGVGLSSPLSCIPSSTLDQLFAANPDVRTPTGLQQAETMYQGIAAGCVAKYGRSLADYNTVETAQDMDLLRQALGNQPLNYLGFSYGTRLGAVYASMYPKTIRTAVFDGAVDPVASDLTNAENQLKGFEQAFDQFAADCATKPQCNVIGPARPAVMALLATANTTGGIPSSNTADPRRATSGLILTAVASALYDQASWPDLAAAILAAQKGDSKELLALADQYTQRDSHGKYTNIWDANTAISCNDARQTFSGPQVQQIATDWASKYPMFGLNFAASLLQCTGWPPSGHPVPTDVNASGSKPLLVVGTLHDPATPYAGAVTLASALGTGELLSWDGEGHTAYGKSPCIDNAVNAYLISDTLPPPNTTCPAK